MFSFQFFRSIPAQKAALLAAREYAELPLDPSLEHTLSELGSSDALRDRELSTRSLWLSSLGSVRRLILKSVAWQCVASVGLVGSLMATRHVLTTELGVALTILLCLSYLGAELTKNVVFYFDIQRRAQIARGVQLHLFGLVNKKLLVLDSNGGGEFSSGNVKTLLSGDVESVEDFITAASASWTPALITLLVTSGPIIALSGPLGAVGIGLTLLQVPLAYYIARYLERYKQARQAEQDQLTTLIGEWVRNVRLVRYLNWEPVVARDIRSALRRFSTAAGKAHLMVLLAYGITYSWWTLPILGMLLVGALGGVSVTPGDFFPAVWMLSLLSNQIQFLPHSLTQYGEAAAAANRLIRFLKLPEVSRHFVNAASRGNDISVERGSALGTPVRLHLVDLSVKYDDTVVIDRMTLTIELPTRTAIVGEVGAGKSTLLKVLIGDLAPSSGHIEVELSSGVRAPLWIEEVRALLRQHIGYSPQEPFLSNARLRENIDLHGNASNDDVETAVRSSELLYDIELFSHGLMEEVGETGINLSGGQKHRVSIARAFLSKRPYLVLDDPLSAVDARTERNLFRSFLELSKGFVLVTHRIDELGQCDRVLVLDRGKIVEDGDPRQLIRDPKSRFRAFVDARGGARRVA